MNTNNENDDNRTASANAHLEQAAGHAPDGTHEVQAFTAPVCIHVHHVRKRLADIDNLSIKGVLDGIVAAGILADDSPQQITQITHSQEKGTPEKTIVTIRG